MFISNCGCICGSCFGKNGVDSKKSSIPLSYALAYHRALAVVASYKAQHVVASASATTFDDIQADGSSDNVEQLAFVASSAQAVAAVLAVALVVAVV